MATVRVVFHSEIARIHAVIRPLHIWHEIFVDIALYKLATVPHDKNVHDLNFNKYDVLLSLMLWVELMCRVIILVHELYRMWYCVGR